MGTRLPAAVVTVSLVALLVATVVAVTTGRSLGSDLNEEQIVALRASGALDVDTYLNSLQRQAESLSSSPQAVRAVEEFTSAHRELLAVPFEDLDDQTQAVVAHHQEEYIEPLAEAGRDIGIRDIVPANSASIHLQHEYAVDTGVIENPIALDDAEDGSRWSEVHQAVHPVYRDVVKRRELVDLMLVDADSGYVVYTTQKHPELGSSVDVGPFSGSVLAAAVDLVREDPAAGAIVTDLAFYDPQVTNPVGAVASPVLDGERLVGVLVMLFDSGGLTELLTADGAWDEGGFPETGETFLVGSDGTLRSEARSYVEDPVAYLDRAEELDQLNEEDRTAIEAAGSTVLIQPAADETLNAIEEGSQSVETRASLSGQDAFSAASPVGPEGLGWSVVSEVQVENAEQNVNDFMQLLIVGAATFMVLLAFAAVAWAAGIVRPVRAISDRLGTEAVDRDLVGLDQRGATPERTPIEVPARSPIEFHRLAESFDSMALALEQQRSDLATARADRLRLLRRMLPPAVADRVARGDVHQLEEIPQASVAAVVVLGLGALVRLDEAGSDRDRVDALHAELDEAAERHGLERVKVVGDAYIAVCGHDRPYIDHAPRAVAFAADARDAIRALAADLSVDLDIAAGVHTGPVTVGMTGGNRLLYDVWGETVTTAHHLARRAATGEILASESTRALLPDSVAVEAAPDAGDGAWTVAAHSMGGSV